MRLVPRKPSAQAESDQCFRYHYRNVDVYLSRKIIAGKRMKLSLTEIAKALSVPITDVKNAWDTLQQDAR